MAESPSGDRLTDGEALFGNGNHVETAPSIAVTQDNDNTNHDQDHKGLDNVLYSDVCLRVMVFYLIINATG